MRRMTWALALALALAAGPAAAQQGQGGQAERSGAFEQACIDLVQGRVPGGGAGAIQALKRACGGLMDARTEEQVQRAERERAERELAQAQGRAQEPQQADVQPGQSAAQPQQGEGVLAAFTQAGRELVNAPGAAMGMRRGGPVTNSLITNPIGYFTGLGFNVEYFRAFQPKLSWMGGARYSTTDASNGTATTFGLEGGVDLFLVGRNNEGLRIGPRVELAVGRENFQGSTTFARLGFGGELGYSFIATNGLTGMLAGGLGGRVAGDDANDDFKSFTGGEFGPYLKLGLGFSW